MGNYRTVFVTGAATGIGRATALVFACNGYTVGGYDIDDDGLRVLAADIRSLGAQAVTAHLDVTDADEMALRIGEFAAITGGRLDVMINNAGVLTAGRFADTDLSMHLRTIDVNAKGVVNGLHAAFPYLKDTPNSVVVNLASASAIYGQPELATYSATKFFVRGITEALDLEWNRHDIRVIAMWPLFVKTDMVKGVTTATTQSLGIHLTAPEIADAILAAVEPSRLRRAVHQVHFPVGSQSKVLATASRFSPGWLTRLANKRLARS